MCQSYHCLPTDLWIFDPTTPKGFYFNRGVYYFGKKVEAAMNDAEARTRKGRKPGPGVERLVNGARLGALEKLLGITIKRHRDPGSVQGKVDFGFDGRKEKYQDKDETIVIKRGF